MYATHCDDQPVLSSIVIGLYNSVPLVVGSFKACLARAYKKNS